MEFPNPIHLPMTSLYTLHRNIRVVPLVSQNMNPSGKMLGRVRKVKIKVGNTMLSKSIIHLVNSPLKIHQGKVLKAIQNRRLPKITKMASNASQSLDKDNEYSFSESASNSS